MILKFIKLKIRFPIRIFLNRTRVRFLIKKMKIFSKKVLKICL